MSDYSILLRLEKMLFINYFKNLIRNPKRMIFYVLYIAFMAWVVVTNLGNFGNSSMAEMTNFRGYFSAGAFIMFFIMSFSMLKQSSLVFKMSDVNLLFPAPMDSRKIMMITLLKKIPTYLLTSAFTLIFILSMIVSMFETTTLAIVMTGIGYTLLFLILEPLSFCIFSISTKLNIEDFRSKLIKWTYMLIGLLILGLIGMEFMTDGFSVQSIVSGIGSKWLHYIPIIGWGKYLVMSAVDGVTTYTYLALAGMSLLYIFIVLLTFYLSNDYYEDVMSMSEERAKLVSDAKQGRTKSLNFHFKKKKVTMEDNTKYAGALDWKRQLLLKRSDFSVYLSMETLLCILIVIGFKFFVEDAAEYSLYFASGIYLYIKFLFSAQTQLDHELKKPFFYLIPDSPMRKIFATVKIDLRRFFINMIAIVLVHVVLNQHFESAYIILPIAMTLFYSMTLFSSYMFNIFLPPEDVARLAVLFKMLQTIVVLLPSFIVLMTIGILTENIFWALAGSSIVNAIISVVFLALSEIMFERLELK